MERRDWDDPALMMSVDEALQRITSVASPLEPVEVSIVDAVGLILANDVIAGADVPPFQNSAMDGYAIRAADSKGASSSGPASLRVIETIAAGSVGNQRVERGEAARIMTGAPLPAGADTVVRFEETDEVVRTEQAALPGGKVSIIREVREHENVRDVGEDLRSGVAVLEAGHRIRPADVGVLAALNHLTVFVHRRPIIAILATGDEVVEPGQDLEPGQIRNSNSYALAAMVKQLGGEVTLLGIANDSVDDLRERLSAAQSPDVYVTSGGVSMGDYDMVKDVLQSEGEVDLWQVRMKPGKPLAFGRIGQIPLLGLPGNPAAALVSFQQFGRPLVLKMLGYRDLRIPEATARLTESIGNRGRRRHFVRGVWSEASDGLEVQTTGITGAAMLSALVRSNCFIVVPESVDFLEAGSTVQIQLFDRT